MIKGSKKMLTIILFVIFLLALTTCVVINLPQFGKLPSGARLEPDTYHARRDGQRSHRTSCLSNFLCPLWQIRIGTSFMGRTIS